VIVTDDSRDFPHAVFPLPQVDEFRFAGWLAPLFRLVEPMHTDLNGTIAVHGVNLKRTGNEFPARFAADVLFYLFGHGLSAHGESTLIMIELHIVCEERLELFQIAPVVESNNARSSVAMVRKRSSGGAGRRLGVPANARQGEQRQEQQCSL
jgi:hypothetical protein